MQGEMFIRELMKQALTSMLEAEMDEHLGYSKHSTKGNNSGNSRNGAISKR
jgi:Transposase and inactivated derivatives